MDAQQILADFRQDTADLTSTRQRPGWLEFSLPYSTITSKFVRVYVRHQGATGHYILSECGDLAEDEYEVSEDNDSPLPYLRAQELLERGNYPRVYCEADTFYWRVTNAEMLTSAMHDMAEFIQLAVNLAAFQQQRQLTA